MRKTMVEESLQHVFSQPRQPRPQKFIEEVSELGRVKPVPHGTHVTIGRSIQFILLTRPKHVVITNFYYDTPDVKGPFLNVLRQILQIADKNAIHLVADLIPVEEYDAVGTDYNFAGFDVKREYLKAIFAILGFKPMASAPDKVLMDRKSVRPTEDR